MGKKETVTFTLRIAGEDVERIDAWRELLALPRAQAVRSLLRRALDDLDSMERPTRLRARAPKSS